jgi:beta-lactamase class C
MGKWLAAQLGSHPLVLTSEVAEEPITPRVRTPGELRRRDWDRMIIDAHYGLSWRVYQLGDQQIAHHSG